MAKKQEIVKKTSTVIKTPVTKTDDKKTLAAMTLSEMVAKVRNLRLDLQGMVVKGHLGEQMSVKEYRLKRKELARLLTLIRQKEIQLQRQKEDKAE